jgi:Ubiquitin-activating enzyme E1 FCCH domain
MGEKIIVGPVDKGLVNNRRPPFIADDAFPQLINAYQWRGRVKRKRGTGKLGRLTRFFNSLNPSYGSISTITLAAITGAGNLLTGFGLQINGNIVPGSVTITVGAHVYTDPTKDGYLTPTGTGGLNTINYATGQIVIPTEANNMASANFLYTPDLPVMGLEDFISTTIQFPGTLAFDPVYSYDIQTVFPYGIYDVSFYKNPTSGTYTEYIQKSVVTPTTWNGQDYQQFWTVNYQNALWATNGINVPFSATNIGMQFKPIVSITVIRIGPPATANVQITGHGLSVGDFIFINETATAGLNGIITGATNTNPVSITSQSHGLITGNTVTISQVNGMTELNGNTYTVTVTGANSFTLNGTMGTTFGAYTSGGIWFSPASQHPGLFSQINFQTGYVTAVIDANNITVEFPNATLNTSTVGGIAQYLTNRSDPTKDCLRWYDGDPTNGSATAPVLNGNLGWVNFAPPVSRSNMSIEDLPAAQYYLVGARLIIPFKDRLLFLGPVVQTSSAGSQHYLPDTIIYSQNGTPYYTASFTGDPSLSNTIFNPILVPANQTATANAYWADQTGFGGNVTAAIDQELLTVGANEDVLIMGFTKAQARLIYSGNEVIPFNFYIINAELGSGSTFSSVIMDQGVITIGSRGFVMTGQTAAQRIDLDIPDEIFQFSLTQNGAERVCSQRDFINEWVYFTYPSNDIGIPSQVYKFPTQTLQYNYRDNSWGIFHESYTTYGTFRRQTGFTWATVGNYFSSWNVWNQPWNAGDSSLLEPQVIAGNQQGFVVFRDSGTNETQSLYIRNIVGSTVTCPDHSLSVGDYIVISGALGTVGTSVNGNIFSVILTPDKDTFVLNPSVASGLTYSGGGLIQRMYIPFIQSKQFPTAWGIGRKTRLGPQQYLFTTTPNGQITLFIFLSQSNDRPYNIGNVVPGTNVINGSLIYSTIIYTCPESTNLGLTPANINLQMVTSEFQSETWHRLNTSLIGDTVQVAFTLVDSQMRDITFSNQFAEIEFHAMILDVNPSMLLA